MNIFSTHVTEKCVETLPGVLLSLFSDFIGLFMRDKFIRECFEIVYFTIISVDFVLSLLSLVEVLFFCPCAAFYILMNFMSLTYKQ